MKSTKYNLNYLRTPKIRTSRMEMEILATKDTEMLGKDDMTPHFEISILSRGVKASAGSPLPQAQSLVKIPWYVSCIPSAKSMIQSSELHTFENFLRRKKRVPTATVASAVRVQVRPRLRGRMPSPTSGNGVSEAADMLSEEW